jgi:hypothetical protein
MSDEKNERKHCGIVSGHERIVVHLLHLLMQSVSITTEDREFGSRSWRITN